MMILGFINDHHDADLGDIAEFAKDALTPGARVRLINDARIRPYGAAAVVFDGPAETTDKELADAIVAKFENAEDE